MTAMSESQAPSVTSHPIWKPQRKCPSEAESVKSVYERFASKHDVQLKKFKETVLDKMSEVEKNKLKQALAKYGLNLNLNTCHVSYMDSFKPIELDYDVCYVRHGKTEGNTEPRIFQGYCDYWENQLNEVGKQQAVDAAKKMEETLKTFKPDLILCSPLGRAIETGEAFYKNHPKIPCRIANEAREQQFGSWDNMQLRFMDDEDICHLFYLDQNVLVKAPKPHRGGDGKEYASENFVDLILREANFLESVNNEPEVKKGKAEGRRANVSVFFSVSSPTQRATVQVLIYGHSMAGAAISVLLGHGKKFDLEGSLGFDGKYIMPNATPTMLKAKSPASN